MSKFPHKPNPPYIPDPYIIPQQKNSMRTLEEIAEKYCNSKQLNYVERLVITKGFIDGYKAAQQEYEAKIKELETQLENWQHNAVHGDEGL